VNDETEKTRPAVPSRRLPPAEPPAPPFRRRKSAPAAPAGTDGSGNDKAETQPKPEGREEDVPARWPVGVAILLIAAASVLLWAGVVFVGVSLWQMAVRR